MELVEGATRYARPWRPVKPLEMIWLERAKSEAHRAQRRWELWPERKESGSGGLLGVLEVSLEIDGEREEDAVLEALERRRKGREGIR